MVRSERRAFPIPHDKAALAFSQHVPEARHRCQPPLPFSCLPDTEQFAAANTDAASGTCADAENRST